MKLTSPNWMTPLFRSTGTVAFLLYMASGAAPAAAGLLDQGEAPEPLVDSTVVSEIGSSGRLLAAPLGVALDTRAREVVLANTGANRIEFYDYRGRPRGSFIHQVAAPGGQMIDGQPKHVAVDPEGRVLVVDAMSPELWVRDFRGKLIDHIALPAPDDKLETGGAGPIAIGSDGRIYVGSRGRDGRVHVLGPDFKWIETWGVSGGKPGQLAALSGLAVAGDSELVVTCVATELAVQIFDLHGRYRRGWGIHEVGPGNFSQPTGVTIGVDGRIWVVDSIRNSIQIFDTAGTLVGVLGGGVGPGSWLYPSALAGDGRGLFALTESGGNRLRLLWIR